MNDLIPCNLRPKKVWFIDGWYAPYGKGYIPGDLKQDHSGHVKVREFVDKQVQTDRIHYGIIKEVEVPELKS